MSTLDKLRDELAERHYTLCYPAPEEGYVADDRMQSFIQGFDAAIQALSEAAEFDEKASHLAALDVSINTRRRYDLAFIAGANWQFEADRARIVHWMKASQANYDAGTELKERVVRLEARLAEYKNWMPSEPKPSEKKLSSEVNRLLCECNRLQNLLDKARLAVDQAEKRAENKLSAAEARVKELEAKITPARCICGWGQLSGPPAMFNGNCTACGGFR